MKTVRNRTIPKAANSAVNTFGNEVVTTLKSIARHYGGEYKPTLAGGSITVPDSPLVITRIGTTGRTPKNHVEVTIENLPLIGYSYEVDDYRTFSQATQSLSSVATNMKVRYLGETGARCTFDVNVDNISKFSTMFQNAVLKMFPEKSAPSRTAAPRRKKAPAPAPAPARAESFDGVLNKVGYEVRKLLRITTVAYGKHDPMDADQLANFVGMIDEAIKTANENVEADLEKASGMYTDAVETAEKEADELTSRVHSLEKMVRRSVDTANGYFDDLEAGIDKIVKKLRALERQHPEISGYDFDDFVREVENLSDEVRDSKLGAESLD